MDVSPAETGQKTQAPFCFPLTRKDQFLSRRVAPRWQGMSAPEGPSDGQFGRALEQRERPRKWLKPKERLRADAKSGKQLVSHAGARLCRMPRGVSLEMPLLCQPAACRFALSFPLGLSSAARRGRLRNEESRAAGVGWRGDTRRWLEPLAYRAPIPGVFGPEPPRQHAHGVIVTPQALSHLKCT